VLFERVHTYWRTIGYSSFSIPQGVVSEGQVRDVEKLASILKSIELLQRSHGVHAALSEETGYVIDMQLQKPENVAESRTAIEFELAGRVPVPVEQLYFDYDSVAPSQKAGMTDVAVTAYPRYVVQGFVQAFELAGIRLISLEHESRSTARAALERDEQKTIMLIDFGRDRSGVSILRHGYPVFTRTIEVGGTEMTDALKRALAVQDDEVENYKNEVGLTSKEHKAVYDIIVTAAQKLGQEIISHAQYWDSAHSEDLEHPLKIARILLCGGNANIKGLAEYITRETRIEAQRAEVWNNIDLEPKSIPALDAHHALAYITSVGLAMRSM
jgi:type IV pilus assembly protein PilM